MKYCCHLREGESSQSKASTTNIVDWAVSWWLCMQSFQWCNGIALGNKNLHRQMATNSGNAWCNCFTICGLTQPAHSVWGPLMRVACMLRYSRFSNFFGITAHTHTLSGCRCLLPFLPLKSLYHIVWLMHSLEVVELFLCHYQHRRRHTEELAFNCHRSDDARAHSHHRFLLLLSLSLDGALNCLASAFREWLKWSLFIRISAFISCILVRLRKCS